jgi:peptidoglycan/LPS O-acetylase OafA/YrhL
MNARPNLDLLRAIAVLLVVVEHTLLAMHVHWIGFLDMAWLGVVGVFMFFVHTSLVLMWSLERKPHILDFYIRRAFRIYPLAIIAILATIAFRIPTMQNVDGYTYFQTRGIGNVITNLLLVQNLGWGGTSSVLCGPFHSKLTCIYYCLFCTSLSNKIS